MTKQSSMMNSAVIITAAGTSQRFGEKKEFLPLDSSRHISVLSSCLYAFVSVQRFSYYVITVPKGQLEAVYVLLRADPRLSLFFTNDEDRLKIVEGGMSRQESVFAGLCALEDENIEVVLVHDGARPWVSSAVITAVLQATENHGAAVPAIPVTDTQKEVDETGKITRHIRRDSLAAVQTPQGFRFDQLLYAHRSASRDGRTYTDDSEIYAQYCTPVYICKGMRDNRKITYREDLLGTQKESRIGLGYDLHRLVAGRPLRLGGVHIPFEKGEAGHSDGDVLLHAITDALLGASCLGDIGDLFPPDDPQWKNADSRHLLRIALRRVQEQGWHLNNVDCVIALQSPKILPFRDAIRRSIAETLSVGIDRVFVKAKTGEGIGIIGTGAAVVAWCTSLLYRVNSCL